MKRSFAAVSLLMIALLVSLAAFADDTPNVAGRWQLSWQGRNGAQQGTLQLQQDGSKISGSLEGERGSMPVSGSIRGNQISFNAQFQARRTITLAFSGTVEGDKISGTIQPEGGGRRMRGGSDSAHTWSAVRQSGGPAEEKPAEPSSNMH